MRDRMGLYNLLANAAQAAALGGDLHAAVAMMRTADDVADDLARDLLEIAELELVWSAS